MTTLQTLGVFVLVFLFVLLVSYWRDAPRRSRAKYQSHDWLVTEHREARLRAASMPHLFKGTLGPVWDGTTHATGPTGEHWSKSYKMPPESDR